MLSYFIFLSFAIIVQIRILECDVHFMDILYIIHRVLSKIIVIIYLIRKTSDIF